MKSIGIFRAASAVFVIWTAYHFYPLLPDTVPVHWNVQGIADNFASKNVATFGFLGFFAVMTAFFMVMPYIDPKKESYAKFEKSWEAIQMAILSFFAYLFFVTQYVPTNPEANVWTLVSLGIGVLFVFMGNYLGKVRSNFFLGIRTPWTLSDETVWNRTHRFAAKTFVLAGILVAALSAWPEKSFPFSIWAILVASFAPVAYSYFLYRKSGKEEEAGELE